MEESVRRLAFLCKRRIEELYVPQLRACLTALPDEAVWLPEPLDGSCVGDIVLRLASFVQRQAERFAQPSSRPAAATERAYPPGRIGQRELLDRAEQAFAELAGVAERRLAASVSAEDMGLLMERIGCRLGQLAERSRRLAGTPLLFPESASEEAEERKSKAERPRQPDVSASAMAARVALRPATVRDAVRLAEWNRQLIADEGSANPMNSRQLRRRMEDWLRADWRADWIVADGKDAGYALYCRQPAPYREDGAFDIYLRQYFIAAEYRGTGVAAAGIEALVRERFAGAESVAVDVLESNRRGRSFWAKAGFLPEVRSLRRSLKDGPAGR